MVVWLTAPADVIRRRLASDPTTASRRPGLTGADPLAEIDAALAARDPLYRECAHECVDTSAASTDEVVAAIVRALERRNGPDASPTEASER
jgi:shikimate kinase